MGQFKVNLPGPFVRSNRYWKELPKVKVGDDLWEGGWEWVGSTPPDMDDYLHAPREGREQVSFYEAPAALPPPPAHTNAEFKDFPTKE